MRQAERREQGGAANSSRPRLGASLNSSASWTVTCKHGMAGRDDVVTKIEILVSRQLFCPLNSAIDLPHVQTRSGLTFAHTSIHSHDLARSCTSETLLCQRKAMSQWLKAET